MNGYEVLDAIRAEDLPTLVLVVSGDIQRDACVQVMAKGALDFIQKPVSPQKIEEVLSRFGIISDHQLLPDSAVILSRDQSMSGTGASFSDSLQEVVNVAMGQAGGRLAELLDAFVHLPVPLVHLCAYNDLPNRLACRSTEMLTGVSHGFNGGGVSGEAILLLAANSFPTFIELLASEPDEYRRQELAVLVDLSGLLISSDQEFLASDFDSEMASLHLMLQVLQTVDVGLLLINEQYEVQLWNSFMENHIGMRTADARGSNLFTLFPELPRKWLKNKIERVFKLHCRAYSSWEQRPRLFNFKSTRPLTGKTSLMYQNVTLIPLLNVNKCVSQICLVIYDVTDIATHKLGLEDANIALENLSRTDSLTGLYNRGY